MTTEDDNEGGKRPFGRKGRPGGPRGDAPRGREDRADRGGLRPPRKGGSRFETGESEDAERIAKRLARAGIASRREAETMIAAGRIAVNGKVLESPAINVKRTDVVTVDGKPLRQAERTRLWLYHKPAGLVTTNRDPEGRPTVFEALPPEMPRVLSVGRLDINTEGLLLLTNDGGLSRVLELPSTGWLRRYRVRAHGKVTQEQLNELKNGIAVDGVFYGSVEAELERVQGANVWISIGLREGKNREVKNILGALGLTVGRLIRVSFGPFQLGDLEEGAVREIRGRTLRDQLGERLIEESGADFDAPVINEFSNTPVQGRTSRDMDEAEGERPRPRREREWISSSPERRRPREDKKDQPEQRRRGNVNVWMGPGARPKGEKAAAKAAAKSASRSEHQQPHRSARLSGDMQVRPRRFEERGPERDGDEERPARRPQRRDDRPDFRSGERQERRGEGRFERRPGKRERAELRAATGEGGEGGFAGRKFAKPEGQRDARRFDKDERPFSKGPRSYGDRPARDRNEGGKGGFRSDDKPRGRPSGGKPFAGKPGGDRPFGGKPGGNRPGGDKPRGGKPGGGRPGGGGADRRR